MFWVNNKIQQNWKLHVWNDKNKFITVRHQSNIYEYIMNWVDIFSIYQKSWSLYLFNFSLWKRERERENHLRRATETNDKIRQITWNHKSTAIIKLFKIKFIIRKKTINIIECCTIFLKLLNACHTLNEMDYIKYA